MGSLELQDLNSDNKPELIALPVDGTSNEINVFINSLSPQSLYPSSPLVFDAFSSSHATVPALELAIGDWNKDSVTDLVVLSDGDPFAGILLSDRNQPRTETIPVTLLEGALSADHEFVNSQQSTVSGTVHADNNDNQYIDGADVGLGGATVFVDENRNSRVDSNELSTITDQNGGWTFEGLTAGEYRIAVIPVSGFLPLSPTGKLG